MPVVVVESPAKAKTINKYLGSDYTVLASYGHVRDLPAKDGSVDPDKGFDMKWEIGADSKKHVKAIADARSTTNMKRHNGHAQPVDGLQEKVNKAGKCILDHKFGSDRILRKIPQLNHLMKLQSAYIDHVNGHSNGCREIGD